MQEVEQGTFVYPQKATCLMQPLVNERPGMVSITSRNNPPPEGYSGSGGTSLAPQTHCKQGLGAMSWSEKVRKGAKHWELQGWDTNVGLGAALG